MQMMPQRSVPRISHQRSSLQPEVGTTGLPVGLEQLLPGAQSRDRRARAEPPGLHAQPAKVLGQVPQMGQLPVQHRPPALPADDEVPSRESPCSSTGSPAGSRLAASSA